MDDADRSRDESSDPEESTPSTGSGEDGDADRSERSGGSADEESDTVDEESDTVDEESDTVNGASDTADEGSDTADEESDTAGDGSTDADSGSSDWYGSVESRDPAWYDGTDYEPDSDEGDDVPADTNDRSVDADGDSAEDADGDSAEDADGDSAEDADGESGNAGDDEDSESVGDGGTATVDDDELVGVAGPETDEEMPLAAHIEEMMRRLAVVFLLGGLATLVVVTESTTLINYFWSYHIPSPLENRPRLYAPLELPLTRLKVAGIAGVVVGLPAFVYQTYRFMKPGLYENERRYYLAAVPTSLVLGAIGVAFAHFLVLPAIFSYFTTYTGEAATIAFGLAETFNLIVIMLAFMAIVFQIPLFIMLAIMMNLVTRVWLEDKRLIFWGAFLGIAFLFSPDPTGMAPIIVTLTMIVLFEGTLAILRWTGN